MAGPWLNRDAETFVQLEAAVNTSPGALAGADAIKCKSDIFYKRVLSRYDRDGDRDNAFASVVDTLVGREHGQYELNGDIVPNGTAGAPTAPDIDNLLEAHMGQKSLATAHTTTHAATPCTATVVNLVAGGGAASGIRTGGGDIIMVDVDATNGLEARRVVSRATDAITVSPAFSAAPGLGRNVYVGCSYNWLETALKSLHLWGYINGSAFFRHKIGGAIARMLNVDYDASQDAPVVGWKLSGDSYPIGVHSTARPTPVVAGVPLLPSQTKIFMGASGKLCATKVGFKSDNGIELRMDESCALTPSGLKRTANNGRYSVELAIDLLLQSGTIENMFDNAASLTGYDTVVQFGVTPGQTLVICAPKWKPDASTGDANGEVALSLGGRCYGSASGNDESIIAFI